MRLTLYSLLICVLACLIVGISLREARADRITPMLPTDFNGNSASPAAVYDGSAWLADTVPPMHASDSVVIYGIDASNGTLHPVSVVQSQNGDSIWYMQSALMAVEEPGSNVWTNITLDGNNHLPVNIQAADTWVPSVQMDVNGRYATIDSMTWAANTIDYAHHEAHDGNHYYVKGAFVLGAADTLCWAVTVGDTVVWPHILYEFQSTGGCTITLLEGATYTGGTAIAPVNNNRNSDRSSLLTVAQGVSLTGYGTTLETSAYGTGGPKSIGGAFSRGIELILRANTTYVWCFQSTAADNICDFIGEWYEHEIKGR